MQLKPAKYFGWVVTAAGLVLMAFSMGIVSNCYSVYTIPVTSDMGYTREEFSFSQTLIFIGMMLMTSSVGLVIKKFGLIGTIRRAAFLVPGIYFLYSVTSASWQFCLVSFLIGAMLPLITTVPLSMLTGEWFKKNAGFALGIIMMGSGIGGMIFNPVISALVQDNGWRFAFRFTALLMLLVMVPVSFLAIKNGPYSSERKTSGEKEKAEKETAEEKTPEKAEDGPKFADTIRTRRFRIFMILAVIVGAGTYSIINFTATYLQDAGYTPSFAAGVASASMAGLAVGKPLLGRIYDRTGLRKTIFIGTLFIIIAEAAFYMIQYRTVIPAAVLGVMIGCPLGTIAAPIITRDIFGNRDFGMKCGLLVSCGNLGAAFTPVFAGELYKKTGSFRLMFLLIAMLVLIALFGYLVLLPKEKNERRRTKHVSD